MEDEKKEIIVKEEEKCLTKEKELSEIMEKVTLEENKGVDFEKTSIKFELSFNSTQIEVLILRYSSTLLFFISDRNKIGNIVFRNRCMNYFRFLEVHAKTKKMEKY
jgi:hypothetical protein